MVRQHLPHVPVEGASHERHPTSDRVHDGDRIPEDEPRTRERNCNLSRQSGIRFQELTRGFQISIDLESEMVAHLEISCDVEGNSGGGVNDVKNREVEAEGQYSRPENDDEGREERGARKEPVCDPWPFQHYGRPSQDHSCERSHVVNCVYAAVGSKTIDL